MKKAYITLLATQEFYPGVVALINSLNYVQSKYPIIVAHLGDIENIEKLKDIGAKLLKIDFPKLSHDFLERHTTKNIHKNAFSGVKPSFHNTQKNFSKIEIWRLEEFDKLVYLDADTIAIQNIDRLFEFPSFTAAPNLYTEILDLNRLNTGVMVLKPSKSIYNSMIEKLNEPNAFFKRTDQTFLNTFFSDWQALPYTYNALQYVYFRIPEIWLWENIKLIHYQYEKPWDDDNEKKDRLEPLIKYWKYFYENKTPSQSFLNSLKNPKV